MRFTEKGTGGHEGVREEKSQPGARFRGHEGAFQVPPYDRFELSPATDGVRGPGPGSAGLRALARGRDGDGCGRRSKTAPKEFMVLENKLREANRQLVQAFNQNEKLVNALYEAREQITSLKEEVDKLCAPPSTYGVYLSANEDGTVNDPVAGAQGEGEPAPVDQGGGDPARAGADPQRGAQRRRDGGVRDPGRGRHPQGAPRRRARAGDAAGGRGPGRRSSPSRCGG